MIAAPGPPRVGAGMAGFMLPVSKSPGPTSRRVVDELVRRLKRRDIGHAGTLDPFASGLLLLMVGRATKLVPYVHEWDKEYVARVRLGVATDSLDPTGAVTATAPVPAGVAAALPAVIRSLVGTLLQVPPALSAVRTGGRRLHELTRNGETPPRVPRPRHVYAAEITEVALPDLILRISCSSGTYVRSLAELVGERLGLPAHLAALHRTRIGPFGVGGAVTDRELADLGDEALAARCVALPDVLPDWPRLALDAAACRAVGQGQLPPPVVEAARALLSEGAAVRRTGAHRPSPAPAHRAVGAVPRVRLVDGGGELVALLDLSAGEEPRLLRVLAPAGEAR